jgi:hypothetical protein
MALGGCDAVAEAKAFVLGEAEQAEQVEQVQAAEAVTTPAAEPSAAPAPEPLLLSRDGVAGLVEDAVARSKAAAPQPVPPPVEDLGRVEPEGSRAFVPFDDGSGAVAGGVAGPERPRIASKPRSRPRPKLARPVEDEPCDPVIATAPAGEWQCGPCGRG